MCEPKSFIAVCAHVTDCPANGGASGPRVAPRWTPPPRPPIATTPLQLLRAPRSQYSLDVRVAHALDTCGMCGGWGQVKRFTSDFNDFVAEAAVTGRFNEVTTAPEPGQPIYMRAITQLPAEDPRWICALLASDTPREREIRPQWPFCSAASLVLPGLYQVTVQICGCNRLALSNVDTDEWSECFEGRFMSKYGDLLAPPAVIALLDEYYGEEVELDHVTVIRNHGCRTRPRCTSRVVDGNRGDDGPAGYLRGGEREELHRPCCGGPTQDFHRDLPHPGSVVLNIPMSTQRPGFGPVRFCVMNATGQGTHMAPTYRELLHRDYAPSLDPLFDPWGNNLKEEIHDELWENNLLPLCNNEDHGYESPDGGREVVSPMTTVGDITIYEASQMHSGTPNLMQDDRDVFVLTYTWRNCPAINFPHSAKWECGECYHCTNKPGWEDSEHGTRGPDGQRRTLHNNYYALRKKSNAIMSEMRTTFAFTYAQLMVEAGDGVVVSAALGLSTAILFVLYTLAVILRPQL